MGERGGGGFYTRRRFGNGSFGELAGFITNIDIYACIAIVPLWVIYAFWDLPAGGPHYWWWQLQLWIFNWDSCAGLTACYDEHGRPCQWVAPLAKDYCASLDELYG